MIATLSMNQRPPAETTDSAEDKFLRRSWFHRLGPYVHLYIIVGLAIPILIYLTMMNEYGWRMPMLGANGVVGFRTSDGPVMLYASPQTRSFLAANGGNYEVLLTPWRDYFSDRKRRYKEINDLGVLRSLNSGVLILPSAVVLGAEERQAIQGFRSRGGAVLATWATGSRNGKGDWEGWQFLESLGARVVGELAADDKTNHFILNGDSPLSHRLPAGQRLFLTRSSESLLRLQGEAVAGRITSWARIPQAAQRSEGGVVYADTSATVGRSVVMAFAESAWANHPALYYSFFDDVLDWLSREPTVVRADWPNGMRAAHVIEMDTEQGFPNAENFGAMMKAVNFPTAFYVLTSEGKKYPEVLKRLNRDFEVGYHGDIHIGFKDQSEAEQLKRLQTMQAEMQSVIPDTRRMTGFRAPTEGYDATTEKLARKMGIRYHVADPNRTEGRLPRFARVDGSTLDDDIVVLPRTQRDDINLNQENLSVEQLTQAMIDDAGLVLENGGLGLLSVHTQNFAADSALARALPGLLLYLKQNKNQFWLASPAQVADWWRVRERVKTSSKYDGHRLEVDVSVTGQAPVNGVTLVVMLPAKGILPAVKPVKVGGTKPLSVTLIDPYRAAIVFDVLKPGDEAYQLTFESK